MKIKKNLFSSDWVSVEVADYNSLGIGLKADAALAKSLQKQELIQISLSLATEVGEITADGQ